MTYVPVQVKVKAGTIRCAASSHGILQHFSFPLIKTKSGRDAPLKQDMVEVVGWISDAQK